MPRWSTSGAAQVVKLVVVPLFGLVMLLIEQQRDEARPLFVAAGFVLIGVAPASVLERFLSGPRPELPPAAPTPPTSPSTGSSDGSSAP
jgi:hypothetical protein